MPSISNGGDEATTSNGGVGSGCLGNKLVENESPHIKPFIFLNAPDEKNLTQMGMALALISGENGVCDNPMKVSNGRVTN